MNSYPETRRSFAYFTIEVPSDALAPAVAEVGAGGEILLSDPDHDGRVNHLFSPRSADTMFIHLGPWFSLRSRRIASVGVYLTLVASGCDDLLLDVEAREVFDPPHLYREWWDQLQRCVGLSSDFEMIEWWTGEAIAMGGADKVGVWLAPNTIILEAFYVTSEPAVKHEMLHHLTKGAMAHSAPEFSRCTKIRSARGTIRLGPRPRG